MKHVSTIIPNYNGRHLMAKHLPAVLMMLRPGDEVVIVDDCSTDDSVAWLKKEFGLQHQAGEVWQGSWKTGKNTGDVILIANEKNLRFAAASNKGVEHAHHPLVFLLNTDVAPEPDVLNYLLPHFEDSSVFAVGCLEKENHDGKEVLGGKTELTFSRGMFIHARAKEFSTGPTPWISGGSSVFDKQKWAELGGFDPDYAPAYWEDVDLCYRATRRGWYVLFEARAIVHHNHESTNKDAFGQKKIEAMSWKNAYTFVRKNATLPQLIQHWLWQPYWWWKRYQVR